MTSGFSRTRRKNSWLLTVAVAGVVGGASMAHAIDGLVHRYSFTTDATDSVGTLSGTALGGVTFSGGQAIFDGVAGSYINYQDTVSFAGNDIAAVSATSHAVSMEFWGTFSWNGDWARVYDLGLDTTNYMFHNAGNFGNAIIKTTGGENGVGGPALTTGTQVHVVDVFDQTTNTVKIYMNGVLYATGSMGGQLLSNVSSADFFMGHSQYAGDPYLKGSINEFRIWDRALDATTIVALNSAGPDALPTLYDLHSVANGAWTVNTTWAGTTPPPSGTPDGTTAATITGNTVTLNSASGTALGLTIGTGGTLTMTASTLTVGAALSTVGGALTMDGTSVLNLNNADSSSLAGLTTSAGSTINVAATLSLNSAPPALTGVNLTANGLTVSGTSFSTAALNSFALTGGAVSVTSNGTLSITKGTHTASNLTIDGTNSVMNVSGSLTSIAFSGNLGGLNNGGKLAITDAAVSIGSDLAHDGFVGSVLVQGTGTLTINGELLMGRNMGTGSVIVKDNGVLSGAGNTLRMGRDNIRDNYVGLFNNAQATFGQVVVFDTSYYGEGGHGSGSVLEIADNAQLTTDSMIVANFLGTNNPVNTPRYGNGQVYQSGGTVTVNGSISMGVSSTSDGILTGTYNLNGGVLKVQNINNGAAAIPGTANVNFHGGTLVYNGAAAQSDFINLGANGKAYIYQTTTIDDGGQAVTLNQSLLSPNSGNGVSAITLAAPIGSFRVTPEVFIEGDGSGATAVAHLNASGQVDSIIVTNPGVGYATTPTVQLFYRGGTTGIPSSSITMTPNAFSGGLVKTGLGTLTLGGNNTFTGDTRVSSGTLMLASDGALGGSTLDMNPADAGSLAFTNPGTLTLGGLKGSVNLDLQTKTVAIGANNASTTYSGVLSNGSVNKVGNGMLTLSATNAFTGTALTVNQGALKIGGTQTGSAGGITVDGGTLATSSALTLPALTIGSTGGTLNLHVGTTTDLITVQNSGGLTVNNAVVVDMIDGGGWTVGSHFNLIGYSGAWTGTLGLFSYTGGPLGATGHFADSGSFIQFVVDSFAIPGPYKWVGNIDGNWDKTTANFVSIPTSSAAPFVDGYAVTFDNTATGTRNVVLNGTLKPASVTVNNTTVSGDYTLTGSGKVSGSMTLTKQGTGALIIANSTDNDYTGGTTISAGTLQIGNGGFEGWVPGDIVNNGTLVFNRADAITFNNVISGTGVLVQQDPNGLTLGAANTFSGDTRLGAGALSLNHVNALQNSTLDMNAADSGSLYINTTTAVLGGLTGARDLDLQGKVVSIGNNNTNTTYTGALSNGTLSKVGTGTLTLNGATPMYLNSILVGAGKLSMTSTSNVILSTGTLTSVASGAMSMSGTSTLTLNAGTGTGQRFSIGEGGTGSMTMTDNAVLDATGLQVAVGVSGSDVGILDMSSNAGILYGTNAPSNAGYGFLIGRDSGSHGTVTVGGSATITGTGEFDVGFNGGVGVLNVNGSATITAGDIGLYVGRLNNSVGTLNMTGGTIHTPRLTMALTAGTSSTVNQSGGLLDFQGGNTLRMAVNDPSSRATYNLSGGTLSMTGGGVIQVGVVGVATFNVSGTGVIANAGGLQLGASNAAASGTVNLNGGIIHTASVTKGTGTGVFNFNGGTLVPTASSSTFMQGLTAANILAGGAKIDTNSNDITIGQTLASGSSGGGITKLGAGTLTLTGTGNNADGLKVSAGKLDLESNLTLNTTSAPRQTPAVAAEVVAGGLTIGASAALDLTNHDLILHYAPGNGAATLAAITSQISSGKITSSALASGFSLGYADNAALTTPYTSFDGISLADSNEVLVKYTYTGDANLDGKVTFADFQALLAGYGNAGTWATGDFNGNGTTTFADFQQLLANYGAGVSSPLAPVGAGVPEPASLGLLAVGALGLLARKRK